MTLDQLNKINESAKSLEFEARSEGRSKDVFSAMQSAEDRRLSVQISRMGRSVDAVFLEEIINEFADVILQVAIARKGAAERDASLRAQAMRMTIAATLGEPMP